MTHFSRSSIIALLGAIGVLATAPPAAAQFYPGLGGYGGYGGFNPRQFRTIPRSYFGALPPTRPITPLPGVNTFNPLMFSPFNVPYNQANANAVTYFYLNRAAYGSNYTPYYPPLAAYPTPVGGYMTGGYSSPAAYAAQRDFGKAQSQSSAYGTTPAGAKDAIAKEWGYEKRAAQANGNVPKAPQDLLDAVGIADEPKLMSGDYLNRLAAEIAALEGRGARGASPQLGPPLLAQVRFAGSPEADALNAIRRAGRLEFPAAFDTVAALKPLKPALERDLVAAVGPIQAGRPADVLAVARLEDDVRQAQAALTPAINSMSFDEATAARRFLNQLAAAGKVLKDPKAVGLVNPKWETEGASVADLLKHMTKYKIKFGPVERGGEEAYLAVHQGLVGYLLALQQNEPKKK